MHTSGISTWFISFLSTLYVCMETYTPLLVTSRRLLWLQRMLYLAAMAAFESVTSNINSKKHSIADI